MERRMKSAARLMIVAAVTGVLNVDEAADLMVQLIVPSQVEAKQKVKLWMLPNFVVAAGHTFPQAN